ncbi:MAG: hypothetical protein ACK5KO_02395 [Arachnia sp.]
MKPEQTARYIQISQLVGLTGGVAAIVLALVSYFADYEPALQWSEWAFYLGAAGVIALLVLRQRQRMGK